QVLLDLGPCRHLLMPKVEGEPRRYCGIYEHRPSVCRGFNCVTWWRHQRTLATTRSASDRLIEEVARLAKRPEPADGGSIEDGAGE
ncbi:MAG: hypothetical protein MI919_37940, partial [Holophagales bacterium]|nr:hypothetical protein [Holophagales bacterium]